MTDTERDLGEGSSINYSDIVTGDVINIDSQYLTVNFTDGMGIWDVHGNVWSWDRMPKEIFYIRNIFE